MEQAELMLQDQDLEILLAIGLAGEEEQVNEEPKQVDEDKPEHTLSLMTAQTSTPGLRPAVPIIARHSAARGSARATAPSVVTGFRAGDGSGYGCRTLRRGCVACRS